VSIRRAPHDRFSLPGSFIWQPRSSGSKKMMFKKLLSGAVLSSVFLMPMLAHAQARVFFVAPKDGATVTSPVHVVFGLEGMGLAPAGDPGQWTRVQHVHHYYHHPDYYCPEPYETYPSHLHIDLLPRAQRRGYGRRMLEQVMDKLRRRGSPGAHLGVSALNTPALGFYLRLGFRELIRAGSGDERCIYMGKGLGEKTEG